MRRVKRRAWSYVVGGVCAAAAALALTTDGSGNAETRGSEGARPETRAHRSVSQAQGVGGDADRADPPGGTSSKGAHLSKTSISDRGRAGDGEGASLEGSRGGERRGGGDGPWDVAETLADGLRPPGGASPGGGGSNGARPVWGDSKATDAEWLRVRIPGEAGDEDEMYEYIDEPRYPVVVGPDGLPLPGYDPVAFAKAWDPNEPSNAVFDESFYEGLSEFDPEWPVESIVVTLELLAERAPAIVEALREIMAEHVPSFVATDHETTRALAFEVARFVIAEAPELPEVMAIARHLIDVYDLGGLMAMYVAKAAWVVLNP